MAALRSVPKNVWATYHAFLKAKNGAAIKHTSLLIGQAVVFRGKHYTVSGSDDDADGGTTVRLVNATIDKEVLAVKPTEIDTL